MDRGKAVAMAPSPKCGDGRLQADEGQGGSRLQLAGVVSVFQWYRDTPAETAGSTPYTGQGSCYVIQTELGIKAG